MPTGASFTPFIVTVTVASSDNPSASIVVALNVVVIDSPAAKSSYLPSVSKEKLPSALNDTFPFVKVVSIAEISLVSTGSSGSVSLPSKPFDATILNILFSKTL